MIEYILQVLMVVCTLLYSYLLLDCKKVAFIFGAISSLITFASFLKTGIYVQGVLFLVYSIIYILTYVKWKKDVLEDLPRRITLKEYIISMGFIAIFTYVLGYAFLGVSKYPMVDAISSALSISAVYLLNRKVIEHAWFFIISNIGSIWICYMTNDIIMILTFVIYMIFNIIRIYTWEKIKKKGETNGK
jgi:nicotinamide mononucleotide transporter